MRRVHRVHRPDSRAAGAAQLVVRAVYGQWPGGGAADTLAATGGVLVRRLSFGAAGTRELRYERLP